MARIDRLRARFGAGCPACRGWPRVWVMGDAGPTPPTACDRCERRFIGLIRRYVGVDPDAV